MTETLVIAMLVINVSLFTWRQTAELWLMLYSTLAEMSTGTFLFCVKYFTISSRPGPTDPELSARWMMKSAAMLPTLAGAVKLTASCFTAGYRMAHSWFTTSWSFLISSTCSAVGITELWTEQSGIRDLVNKVLKAVNREEISLTEQMLR